jgi:putative DNA methylase
VQPGTAGSVPRRKLIEVSLPLEDINAESAREKSIRHGHPSTLHLWWARRPLAAARAVLFAQLVDDPSSHPELFPTEEEQKAERERLHGIIRRLVVWENINDEGLYREAREEIAKSTGGNPPAILDPFAGGGTIPLEAQRLGLEAHASDLNPVPVLINKALIEIPPKFAGQPPVFPGAAESRLGPWTRATGLAEDIRRYGALMRERALERIGHLYPKALVPVLGRDGEPTGKTKEATVIAWIWARTVICPNPACGILTPLARSWWLSKKKGKEAYVVPTVVDDATAPGGRCVKFRIGYDTKQAPPNTNAGTMSGQRGGACVACQTSISATEGHLQHDVSDARKPTPALVAVVASAKRRRIYLPSSAVHTQAARDAHRTAAEIRQNEVGLNAEARGTFGGNAQGRRWGFFTFADYFTDRQLIALTTLSDLIGKMREKALADSLASGLPRGERLENGGIGAEAYADAVAIYLGMALSRTTDLNNSLVTWSNGRDQARNLFARQAIPMAWDFVEVSPFAKAAGDISIATETQAEALDNLPGRRSLTAGKIHQADAASRDYERVLISTDPPYYDNIVYSDVSDFFYVWLRRSLRSVYPNLFGTMLVPKDEELVANPYRKGGKEKAEKFFEEGFENVFARARKSASPNYPITVFYAFKQAELEKEGVASTGWSTFLEGMARNGWAITATWPVRSERGGRMVSVGTNALASSIVLALRPREASAPATDRTGFLVALHAELEEALPRIREGAIAPADLRQTILGPGMAVFSRFSRVLEDDGHTMSVKTALALINQTFDALQNEHDAALDADTRFCLDWFRSYGWDTRPYGDAESLAVPLGLSVEGITRGGILTSGGGKVALIKPLDMDPRWDPAHDDRLSLWEVTCHLSRAYATKGREQTAKLMAGVEGKVDLDEVNRLATRLYELTEPQDASVAGLFNGLGGAWADVSATSTTIRPVVVAEMLFGEEI